MPRITQQELEGYLWGAATLLRGTIDAGDYKQYIFPLLFLKRLSDVYDEEVRQAMARADGDPLFAHFPENHRFQIPEGAHWSDVRQHTSDIGASLQAASHEPCKIELGMVSAVQTLALLNDDAVIALPKRREAISRDRWPRKPAPCAEQRTLPDSLTEVRT